VATEGGISVVANHEVASTSTIAASSPGYNLNADNSASYTLTVTLKDAYGNTVSGVQPTVTSGTGGATFTSCAPAAATNGSGVTTCTMASNSAGGFTTRFTTPVNITTPVSAGSAATFDGQAVVTAGGVAYTAGTTVDWGSVSGATGKPFVVKNVSGFSISLSSSPPGTVTNTAGTCSMTGFSISTSCVTGALGVGSTCTDTITLTPPGGDASGCVYNGHYDMTASPGGTMTILLTGKKL
jgi:hypothetical protein